MTIQSPHLQIPSHWNYGFNILILGEGAQIVHCRYVRAIGTMTMGNLGKATVKVRHNYFFLYFILTELLFKIIQGTTFKFSGISKYSYNFNPSID